MTDNELLKIRDQNIKLFHSINGMFVPIEFMAWLTDEGFFTAPASTKYHGSHPGGLFEHSLAVTQNLIRYTEKGLINWLNGSSPFIVGMFHDLCKIDQYILNDDGTYSFNDKTLLKGHGDKSVMLLSQYEELTEEEIVCIRYHMGAFTDKSEWNDYTRAVSRYPNVLWTHTADMEATHINMK